MTHLKETKRTSKEWPRVLRENRGPSDGAIHIYSLEYIKQCESHAFRHIPTLNQLPLGTLAGLNSGEVFAISLEFQTLETFLSELVEKCLRSRKGFQNIKTCSVRANQDIEAF